MAFNGYYLAQSPIPNHLPKALHPTAFLQEDKLYIFCKKYEFHNNFLLAYGLLQHAAELTLNNKALKYNCFTDTCNKYFVL